MKQWEAAGSRLPGERGGRGVFFPLAQWIAILAPSSQTVGPEEWKEQ